MASLPASPLSAAKDSALADLLLSRRSTAPDSLVAPGPSRAEIDQLVSIAMRVPDHGRIGPWRLVLIADEAKARWLEKLFALAETREDAGKSRVTTKKLVAAPLVIVIVSAPVAGHKVPEWEQQLSAGAVGMNLLNGAAALGYGANWLTGWHAYDPAATALIGLGEDERVAGVVLVGSMAEASPERERADPARVVTWLEI